MNLGMIMFRVLTAMFLLLPLTSVLAEESQDNKNYLGVFVGITEEDRRDSAPTLAIEYARRLSERFGIGGVVEYAFGDANFLILAVPFNLHLNKWKLYVAPGIEIEEDGDEKYLTRLGIEYGFDVGSIEIAPTFNVDFVDGDDVVVVGVVFTKGF